MTRVRIDRRFCGPPDSGNGGTVCGLIAKALGGSDCEVTLKVPPPLDRDLTISVDGDVARLTDGDTLVGEARRADVSIRVPRPPCLAEAQAAEARFTGFDHHIFPTCFVCGPDRDAGDGLRIFAGATGDGTGQVAAAWTPGPSLLDESGHVRTEYLWAALDCPGYFAVQAQSGPAVLARFAATLIEPEITPEPLIVTGWPIASEGRKHRAGTALHSADGKLLAAAEALWITLRT